jgi:hypothetical protein
MFTFLPQVVNLLCDVTMFTFICTYDVRTLAKYIYRLYFILFIQYILSKNDETVGINYNRREDVNITSILN